MTKAQYSIQAVYLPTLHLYQFRLYQKRLRQKISQMMELCMILYEQLATYELSTDELYINSTSCSFTFVISLYRKLGDDLIFPQVYRKEFLRVQPTFPQDSSGSPKYELSDEFIMVQDDTQDWNAIKHKTIEDVLNSTLDKIKLSLGVSEE